VLAHGDPGAARRGGPIAVALEPDTPAPLRFGRPGHHVVALRFASPRARWAAHVGFGQLVQVQLGRPESTRAMNAQRRGLLLEPTLMIGGALVLALLHVLLFFYYRSKPENLFYAALTAGMAGIGFGSMQISFAATFSQVVFYHLVFKLSVLAASVVLLRFYYAILAEKVPLQFWIAAAVGAAMGVTVYWVPVPLLYAFSSVLVLESVRVLVVALRHGRPGARLLGLGGAVFAVLVLMQMLPELLFSAQVPAPFYIYGFVALMVSMSTHLARDIAGTNQELSLLRQLEVAHRELQETQAKLVQSEKMASLGQLVAGVAHEINTPVGAVASAQDSMTRGLAKLRAALEARDADYAAARDLARPLKALDDAAEVIASGSARVSEIVKRLRRFARLDEAEWQRADLRVGMDDTLLLLQHELKHGVEVRKRYGAIPPITCHPSQINQVFLNLLVNAVQAMDGKGVIEIDTRAADGKVFVEIRDDGKGIAPEHLSRIFDPGFTTKGVGVGTGLGLSICYRIVQAHHGEIRVESEPGAGARFTVVLPVEQPESDSAAAPAAAVADRPHAS
jgi:signal transduction histidine kinase